MSGGIEKIKKCLNKYTNFKLYISYSNLKKVLNVHKWFLYHTTLQLILFLGIILHIVIVYKKVSLRPTPSKYIYLHHFNSL